MLRIWNDRENRTSSGALIIQPLHQVHDAVSGQFPSDGTEWAISKIRDYFGNKLIIAGQHIQIPFEGAYGRSRLKEVRVPSFDKRRDIHEYTSIAFSRPGDRQRSFEAGFDMH